MIETSQIVKLFIVGYCGGHVLSVISFVLGELINLPISIIKRA